MMKWEYLHNMEANELMVGDWIGRVFDDKRIIEDYRQVDWIKTGEIGMRYRKVWSIGCIEPIPLTTEILEKNGFWEEGGGYAKFVPMIGKFTTWKSKLDGSQCILVGSIEKPLHYVHELQHALRLCGLNELADNFKIETTIQ